MDPVLGQDRKPVDAMDAATGFRVGLRWVGLMAGQAALVSALLYYFGWARMQSFLSYFGLDNSMVPQSWNDYIIRSSNVIVRALVLLCIITACMMFASSPIGNFLTKRPKLGKRLSLIAYILAGLLFGLGVLGFFNVIVYSRRHPLVPFFFIAACLLLLSGAITSTNPEIKQNAKFSEEDSDRGANSHTLTPFRSAFLVLTSLLSIFWIVAVYASVEGFEQAREVEEYPATRPQVTLYSETDIGLSSPVEVTISEDGKYPVRYSNLRLLLYSSEKFILLPDNWQQGRDSVYIIRDSPAVRVEITRYAE